MVQATVSQEINGLYVALYGRAADGPGVNYWISLLSAYDPAVTSANAATLAISVADETYLGQQFVKTQSSYFNTQYGSLSDLQFVQALYTNIGGNTGNASGIQYWLGLLAAAEASGETLQNARAGLVGQFARDILSIDLTVGAAALGLSAADYAAAEARQAEFQNKDLVSQFYASQSLLPNGGILLAASTTSAAFTAAQDAVAGVTNDPATVTAADNTIVTAVAAGNLNAIVGTTYPLTTGVDNLTSSSPRDVVTGTISFEGYGYDGNPVVNTLNPGDTIAMNGGMLQITDSGGYLSENAATNPNELTGVTVTGPFNFAVQASGAKVSNFDFIATQGVTSVAALNSSANVYFDDLPTGTKVIASGAGQSGNIYFTMLNAVDAVSVGVDGGVNGVIIENYIFNGSNYGSPTSASISSTGAANGFGSPGNGGSFSYDIFYLTHAGLAGTITSLTIDATTSLNADLSPSDYAATAALVVSGAADEVVLSSNGLLPFKTIDASGLTNGSLGLFGDSNLVSFLGGGGGSNALYFQGQYLAPDATSINGGGGSDNILAAQFVNASNASIFTNWQILAVNSLLDATSATPFNAAILTSDTITGVVFEGNDSTVGGEHILNLAPAATVQVTGIFTTVDSGLVLTHSAAGDSLAVAFSIGGGGTATLESLTSTGDAAVSIASNSTANFTEINYLNQLNETNNVLTTVTITGSSPFYLGGTGAPNSGDGVVTDSAISAAGVATTTAASLTLIDASATTGGVVIMAGASNVAAGAYVNGGTLAANNTITYTGLTIKGGSGQDQIENDANNGLVIDGNHNGDVIYLGGSGANATFANGANDVGYVGQSQLVVGPAGNSLGDTFTFGAGATAVLHIGIGAEAGSTAGTLSIGQTNVIGAAAGMGLDFTQVTAANGAVNENAAIAASTSLTNAENAAVDALGAAGVVYFNYGINEYVIAVHATEAVVSSADAVVELVGIANHAVTNTAGIVTLA
jgi:hypothetical protein